MKIILLATFLLVCCLGFNLQKIVTDDEKVKIDFYYESLCPYCQQFIERSLKVASQTKVKHLIIERISGKYAILTFILTEMPREFKMGQAGHLHANMEKANVKET